MRKLLYIFGCWLLILTMCQLQECIDISENSEFLNNLLSKSQNIRPNSFPTFEMVNNDSSKYYKAFILDSNRLIESLKMKSRKMDINLGSKVITYLNTILLTISSLTNNLNVLCQTLEEKKQ